MRQILVLIALAGCSGNYSHQRAYILSQSEKEPSVEEHWEAHFADPENELHIEEALD